MTFATNLATINREKKIYLADKERVDLFIEPNDGKSTPFGVELKCRTKGETTAEFQKRFLEDVAKIYRGIRQIEKPCLMWVMAISNDPAARDGWDKFAGNYGRRPKEYIRANGWDVILWVDTFK